MNTQYEIYVEVFEITEWRDDSVYKTVSLGTDWFDQSFVKDNKPRETNLMYVAANDEFAKTHTTIRVAK